MKVYEHICAECGSLMTLRPMLVDCECNEAFRSYVTRYVGRCPSCRAFGIYRPEEVKVVQPKTDDTY